MPDIEWLQASYPLFASEKVEILEWSFDTLHHLKQPDWLKTLLKEYSANKRLLGHGVTYSMFASTPSSHQNNWLSYLHKESKSLSYQHISEHFGFMTGDSFHSGTSLPVPLNSYTLELGRQRLQQLFEIVGIPVGLENLAFAFGRNDVEEQGTFLDQLLQPIDGFLILDLHNLYCQIYNFNENALKLLQSYPLHRVTEIHVSGGSYTRSSIDNTLVRRDTHDDDVPEAVFELLELALTHCPNIRYVIFERLGNTFKSKDNLDNFQQDFYKIKSIVKKHYEANVYTP